MLRSACLYVVVTFFVWPCEASAQITWNSPAWTLTPSTSTTDPTYAGASTTIISATSDLFSVSLFSYANADMTPGGPTASATIQFSRSFHLDSTMTDIPVRAIVTGQLNTFPPFGGTTSTFTLSLNPPPFGLSFSATAQPGVPVTLNYDQTANYVSAGTLAPGDYTVSGTVFVSSSCFSGSGTTANAMVQFGLPGVTPIPEPGLMFVVVVGAGVIIRRKMQFVAG